MPSKVIFFFFFFLSPRRSDPAAAEMKRIESSNNPVDIATLATSGDFHLLASEDSD